MSGTASDERPVHPGQLMDPDELREEMRISVIRDGHGSLNGADYFIVRGPVHRDGGHGILQVSLEAFYPDGGSARNLYPLSMLGLVRTHDGTGPWEQTYTLPA